MRLSAILGTVSEFGLPGVEGTPVWAGRILSGANVGGRFEVHEDERGVGWDIYIVGGASADAEGFVAWNHWAGDSAMLDGYLVADGLPPLGLPDRTGPHPS